VATAATIGLIVADSAIAPNFISPLSDPAGIIGILFLVPALLRLLRVERPGWRELAAVTLAAVWTIGAKTQLVSILPVVLPCLLVRRACLLPRPLAGGAESAEIARGSRVPGAVACLLLIGFTVAFQQTQSRWLNEIIRYDAAFMNILGHSDNVPGDLHALGLDPRFKAAAGSSVVAGNSAAALPEYPQFLERFSFTDEAEFYATHPLRLFGVADRGMEGLSATRPTYLGNYPVTAGRPPYTRECRVCVAEFAFTIAEPLRWVVYPVLWTGTAILGLFVALRGWRSGAARAGGGVLAAVSLATVGQFWLVMLSDGDSDLQKHMLFTVFGTCLLGPLTLAALAGLDQGTAAEACEDEGADWSADGVALPEARGAADAARTPAAAGPETGETVR
jgi:hypothetical protein